MVSNELMNLTLGDDELLTEETVTEILERVTGEIKKEETDRAEQSERNRLTAQQALEAAAGRSERLERDRVTTQQALENQIEQNNKIGASLYWECKNKAKLWARGISLALAVILLIIIAASSLESGGLPPGARWSIVGILAVLTAANLLYGLTVKGVYNWIEANLRTQFVKRQAETLGVDLEEYGTI